MATLKNTTINDTGFLALPSGPSGARPGTSTDVFTRLGTQTWTAPAGVTSVEVLVVGGGGGGVSGGGGAGGVVYHSGLAVTPGTAYTLTVGSGGVGGVANAGANRSGGQSSTFHTITANGGGHGGSNDSNNSPSSGGSGGGGGATSTVTQTGAAAGSAGSGGTASFANAGGTSTASAAPYASAGGGGAGAAGQSRVSADTSGAGGDGVADSSINNILAAANAGVVVSGTRRIAGGGGGNTWNTGLNGGRGGAGGGGNGSHTDAQIGTPYGSQPGNTNGEPGQPGTGSGGGGGAGGLSGRGGDGGSGIVILRYTTNQTSTTPANGMMRYNSTNGTPEFYINGSWRAMPLPFVARTIITTAYMMGGYKGTAAWNNVNRTVSATDTTTNLGDNSLERSFNYQSGACGQNNAFVFGAGNAHATPSNYVIGFNMRTETQLTSGFSRTVANNNYNTGTVFKESEIAWTSGGGSALTEEFNLTTQTVYSVNANIDTTAEAWAMSHENYGIFYGWGGQNNFVFATRTVTARSGTAAGTYHQQKAVQSKLTSCYAGNEGTYEGGFNLRRTNMFTNITTAGIISKPYGNSGEENFTMGQDHQYMLGCFDGLQNNVAWKFTYSTETGFLGDRSMQPKGKGGASSGVCAWRN
jgi:hypothetical protein